MMFMNFLFLLCFLCNTFSVDNALPITDKSQEETFVPKAVTLLGDDLLQSISKAANTEENILLSPFNIYSALALIHLGAAGQTREELQNVLGIPDSENDTWAHETVSNMINKIETKATKNTLFTETSIANGLFMQNGVNISDSYLKNATRIYKSSPIHVDFAASPRLATDTINNWVSSKTKGQIPALYKTEIEPSTSVLLSCALYFNGKWKEPFSARRTQEQKFKTENGKEIDIPLMNNVKRLPYITDSFSQYEAIRIPYEKDEYEMIIVLPTGQQTLKNLTAGLKYDNYKKLFDDPGTEGLTTGVDYKIPRMKFSWSQSIKEALIQKVGTLFNNANLSNLVDGNKVQVSDIAHATEIEVNEKGTKASALTGIKFVPYMSQSNPTAPKPFVVDRSFLMMIYYRPSSVLLFYGSVYNPLPSGQ